MNGTYRKPLLFLSMILTLSLILLSLLLDPFFIVMIDVIFMTGLTVLILGGFIWIIDKGVYSRVFINIKKYLQKTSKIESFIETHEAEPLQPHKEQKEKTKGFPFHMIISGITLIIISALLAIL